MFWSGKKFKNELYVDIHSHLIPGIDDGSRRLADSIKMIEEFQRLGYHKAITTPHIHPNYPNSAKSIQSGLETLKNELVQRKIDFSIEAAAEYYVDDVFFEKVSKNEPILTFGDNYVLVESSFMNKPMIFESCLFELKSKGYQPVLAHPERYRFLEGSMEWLDELKQAGVLFQVTLASFVGFYGETPKKLAKKLLRNDMIDFLGSDLHHISHMKSLENGLSLKEIRSLSKSGKLKNRELA